tara:strand:- start:371 stop:754 length:384 start_codon:yes stop_codon:yes gene_type:complete
MIKNFLIISCIGKDDKLGLRINKDFFVHDFDKKKIKYELLVSEILKFIEIHQVKLNNEFSVILNRGPGSFSAVRIALAVAKGLEISKKIMLFGYKNNDLKLFNIENIEKLLDKNLIEKKLIKPIYLS